MPPVYLDKIRLQSDHGRYLMNVMGALSETCEHCGGSVIEVKRIHLQTGEGMVTFFTWCSTCGSFIQFSERFSENWLRSILDRVALELPLAG